MSACWEGLQPGTTLLAEVQEFYNVEFNGDFESENYRGDYTIFTAEYVDRRILAIADQNYLIKIYVSGPNDLTLGKILQTLDEPQYVDLSYSLTSAGPLSAVLHLYYPEQGFFFILHGAGITAERNSEGGADVCINEEANTLSATVVVPGPVESIMEQVSIPYDRLTHETIASIVDRLVSWPGFGCIPFPYPP